jgi:hypothetical protein
MGNLFFDVSLHPFPGGAVAGLPLVDPRGTWPTIVPPADAAGLTMASDFELALERLAALERAFVEPDGSFVWVGPGGEGRWQIDGNAYERHGRVLVVETKGTCPEDVFNRFLAVWGWPEQALAVQLVRAGVFVDEPTFRRHAVAEGQTE